MTLLGLLGNTNEAVIEIEDSYIQFAVPESGKWESGRMFFNGRELKDVVKAIVPKLNGIRQVSLVLHSQSGSKILPFPSHLSLKEIISHLELKREEYFGTRANLIFGIRDTGSSEGQSREKLISFVHKDYLSTLKSIFEDLGCSLNRVVTVAEALIGAYEKQKTTVKTDQVCLLALGFSDVNMVVINKGKIIGLRTSITGSLKELENRLMKSLKLSQEEVKEYFLGNKEDVDQSSLEIIEQNKRELLARITPFFAFIRSKKGISGKQTILLAMPYIKLVGVRALLEKTFASELQVLNAGEKLSNDFDGDLCWLAGATKSGLTSLLPPKPPFFRFSLTPRIAWLFIFFFMFAPLAFIRLNTAIFKYKVDVLKLANKRNAPLMNSVAANQNRIKKLMRISSKINQIKNKQSFITPYLATIASQVDESVRLTEFVMSPETGILLIKGISCGTTEAIKFWNKLEKLPLLKEVKISFPNGKSSDEILFSISAKVNN